MCPIGISHNLRWMVLYHSVQKPLGRVFRWYMYRWVKRRRQVHSVLQFSYIKIGKGGNSLIIKIITLLRPTPWSPYFFVDSLGLPTQGDKVIYQFPLQTRPITCPSFLVVHSSNHLMTDFTQFQRRSWLYCLCKVSTEVVGSKIFFNFRITRLYTIISVTRELGYVDLLTDTQWEPS